jgi:hypothetical protein
MRVMGTLAAILACVAIAGCGSETANGESTASASSHSSSTQPPATCDAAAISHDLGYQKTVKQCYGDWAEVDAGGPGDSLSIVRLVNGAWTTYASFPTSICNSKARSDGVPEQLLANFPPC